VAFVYPNNYNYNYNILCKFLDGRFLVCSYINKVVCVCVLCFPDLLINIATPAYVGLCFIHIYTKIHHNVII